MKELHELRDRLCDELKGYGKKEMSAGSLDVVDKLSHAIKNIDKIIEAGDGYSNGYMPMHHENYYSRNRRRDSMGRYSYGNEEMVSELRDLMHDAPDEKTRAEFQRFISKIEGM